MAAGTIPKIVKEDSFSGTTDSNGNVRLTNTFRKVIAVKPDNTGTIAIPWYYQSTTPYTKILTSSAFAPVANTNVTGTYWYVD